MPDCRKRRQLQEKLDQAAGVQAHFMLQLEAAKEKTVELALEQAEMKEKERQVRDRIGKAAIGRGPRSVLDLELLLSVEDVSKLPVEFGSLEADINELEEGDQEKFAVEVKEFVRHAQQATRTAFTPLFERMKKLNDDKAASKARAALKRRKGNAGAAVATAPSREEAAGLSTPEAQAKKEDKPAVAEVKPAARKEEPQAQSSVLTKEEEAERKKLQHANVSSRVAAEAQAAAVAQVLAKKVAGAKDKVPVKAGG